MDEPKLIALHGARGAGKDTAFDFIVKWGAKSDPALSAVRGSFADRVKWAYMRQWVPDCTMKWAINFIDQYKNDPDAFCVGRIMQADTTSVFIPPVNFRDHMNQFATESAREVYGDDFWVDMLLPKEPTDRNPEGWRGHFLVPPRSAEEDPYSFAHFAVITDLRAPNEMERITELGGLKVKINRFKAEQKQQRYYEEKGLDSHLFAINLPDDQFDVVISNNMRLEDLSRSVAHLMSEIQRNGIASIKQGNPRPWRI